MALNFILALLPIIWLFVAFLMLKLPGHIGCLIALLTSVTNDQRALVLILAWGFGGQHGRRRDRQAHLSAEHRRGHCGHRSERIGRKNHVPDGEILHPLRAHRLRALLSLCGAHLIPAVIILPVRGQPNGRRKAILR